MVSNNLEQRVKLHDMCVNRKSSQCNRWKRDPSQGFRWKDILARVQNALVGIQLCKTFRWKDDPNQGSNPVIVDIDLSA